MSESKARKIVDMHRTLEERDEEITRLREAARIDAETVSAQAVEITRLRAIVVEWERLRDPHTLHVNLLRGFPARLDRATFLHLAGADQLMHALQEADTMMGHDDAETEWRNKWAGLWPNVRANLARSGPG